MRCVLTVGPLCLPQFKAGYDEVHATTADALGWTCLRGKRCSESSEKAQVGESPPLCVSTVVSVCVSVSVVCKQFPN